MAAKATGWIDQGAQGLRVWIDIPLRKNGLPNTGCMNAVLALLETVNPAAFDPPEPVPEIVARAALRDGLVPEYVVVADNHPPVPVFDDDEIPGYRCANGTCIGD